MRVGPRHSCFLHEAHGRTVSRVGCPVQNRRGAAPHVARCRCKRPSFMCRRAGRFARSCCAGPPSTKVRREPLSSLDVEPRGSAGMKEGFFCLGRGVRAGPHEGKAKESMAIIDELIDLKSATLEQHRAGCRHGGARGCAWSVLGKRHADRIFARHGPALRPKTAPRWAKPQTKCVTLWSRR